MKVSYPQLVQHLTKQLAPMYLISGDELLLVNEAAAIIRKTAQLKGHERTIIDAEGPDWGKQLYAHLHGLSLFSEKKLLEVNLSHLKINQTIGKILEEHVLTVPPGVVLLVLAPKLDAKLEKSKWYQSIHAQGVVLPCWPVPAAQLPQWIIERAKQYALTMNKKASEQLAQMVEGNLFAAMQEIEKLSLLQADTFDLQTIEDCVTDNAHFDIFNLVDSALLGESDRCLRIIENLLASDVGPTLLLWAISRELRTLAEMKKNILLGASSSNILSQFRVWGKRKPCICAFLERHTVQSIWGLCIHAAKIDRIIKGAEMGDLCNEFKGLALNMAGNGIIKTVRYDL